jgi:ribosomal protein S18 acetylase RimI-like enzyme
MKKKIRKAKEKDLKEIAEIFMLGSNSPPYNEKWDKKTALNKIKGYVEDKHEIYVAIMDNHIVGFITAKPEYLYRGDKIVIAEFYVKKEFQNKGIGTALLNKIEKIYKKNAKTLALITHVSAPALKFYKDNGFEPQKQVIFMKKRLR